jgi:hypothetical protein
MLKKILFLFLLVIIPSTFVVAAFWDFKYLESEYYTVFYPQGYESKAKETLYYLELQRPLTVRLTGNKNYKVTVVLDDGGLRRGGAVDISPKKITILTGEGTTYWFFRNWFEYVAVHEQTHIGQLTNSSGLGSFFSSSSYAANANLPIWMVEGITTYAESRYSPYSGMLKEGLIEAIVRAKAKAGKLPSVQEATFLSRETDHYPYYNMPYVFGGTFFRYLAQTYGEKSLAQFFNVMGTYVYFPDELADFIGLPDFMGIPGISRKMDLFPSIRLDKVAREVFGKGFVKLFADWQKYEEKRSKDWQIVGTQITHTGSDKSDTQVTDGQNLFFMEQKAGRYNAFQNKYETSLKAIDLGTKKARILTKLTNSVDITMKIAYQDQKIFYAVNDYGLKTVRSSNYTEIPTRTIYSFDLNTKQTKAVLEDAIFGFFVVNEDEIYYLKQKSQKFGSELWLYKNGQKTKLADFKDDLLIEILPYQDEFLVVSKKNTSSWNIYKLDLNKKELEPLITSPWTEKNVFLQEDKLIYTANYEGHYGIYEYSLVDGQINRLTQSSDAQGGVITSSGDLFFSGMTANGLEIFTSKVRRQNVDLQASKITLQKQSVLDFSLENLKQKVLKMNEYEIKDGAWKNLSYLLVPYSRIITNEDITLYGTDALAETSYQVAYNYVDGGVALEWTSKLWDPVQTTFYTDFATYNQLSLSSYLYRAASPGLTAISAAYSFDLNSKAYLSTALNFYFNYLDYTFSETLALDRAENISLETDYTYYWGNGSLNWDTYLAHSLNLGWDWDTVMNSGYSKYTEVSITQKIFQVQQGWWEPNIFLGDVFVVPRIRYLMTNDVTVVKWLYGINLALETRLALFNMIKWYVDYDNVDKWTYGFVYSASWM